MGGNGALNKSRENCDKHLQRYCYNNKLYKQIHFNTK